MTKLIVILTALTIGAHASNAAVFNYAGVVTAGSGSLGSLVPLGTHIGGVVEIDSPMSSGTVSNTSAVQRILLQMTSPTGFYLFCFNYRDSCSSSLGPEAPIMHILQLDLTFDQNGNPVLGIISTQIDSPSFMLPVGFDIDITNRSFWFGVEPLGTVVGAGKFVIPLPGAVWLLISAVMGLVALPYVST